MNYLLTNQSFFIKLSHVPIMGIEKRIIGRKKRRIINGRKDLEKWENKKNQICPQSVEVETINFYK